MSIVEELDRVQRSAICVADEQRVTAALDAMAAAIERAGLPEPVVLMCVMNGGMIVAAELLQRLSGIISLDYIHASRYRQQLRGDAISWRALPGGELQDKAVIVVDDIFDEGITLGAVVDYCQAQGASRVLTAVLVDKRHGRKRGRSSPDVVGLTLPDRYLFGMGMDYKGYLRNSRAIFALSDT
jgi:hypoxanthine phosphoribosyltransferase